MNNLKWEIKETDALGRYGTLVVNSKQISTPNLFPVVHPYRNNISISFLKKIGAQCLFTNAYIMYQNAQSRDEILRKGIHQYLNFDGIIATDSGAFQKYMYNQSDIKIQADNIEKFQENINTDFAVILDEPVQPDDDYSTAKRKVFTTIQRAKDNVNRRIRKNCYWFAPIHGAKYTDLLITSTIEMNKLDFGIYAIGGLVKLFLDYRFDTVIRLLLNVKRNIKWDKPIHMFGLGLPQFFSLAVACGCDLMDSAAYFLYAKEKRYFTLSTGTKRLEELEEFPCHCPICCDYNPREIRSFEDELQIQLVAKHNLYVSFSELRTVRQAIKEGNLWELVEQRIRSHPNLVNAANIIKSELPFFEKHEKRYKTHGRLYSSIESLNRPLFYRYENWLWDNYRVPKSVKFLIILPELDIKSEKSPSLRKWIKEIDENLIIHREFLHILFLSEYYGIIPFGLRNTFPLGQYDSQNSSGIHTILYKNMLSKAINFFKKHSHNYLKCGIFVPEKFINQFNESMDFYKKENIYKLIEVLKAKFKLRFSIFNNIEDLLQFFKET